MFRRLLSVGGFTLLSRITGFARDICMAWILGRGILSDATDSSRPGTAPAKSSNTADAHGNAARIPLRFGGRVQ